uniref:ENT domain-containing protein n=1 Tax=Meloidogyne incognita TaxID=6306 RepID=A0A914LN16_MELIC
MQPSTSAVQNLASNILDEKDLEEEDAKFLLKALEKQAFEHVLYAFRAQGPLTKYKELILEHLKSALFITDQEFFLNLRIAANNPYLNEIVQKLNPSYDNFSEWLAAGLDLTGAELANSRRQQSNNNNSTLSDNSTQILREIRRHNRNLSRESNVASEAIAELYQLPKRPFMPERLRKLLRDTEADGAVVDIPTETIKKEKSEILPQITTKNITTTTTTKLAEATKQIKKRNVGRPRKYPRKEETNNNNNNNEQHKQQEKHQQTKEETQKQTNNNNNHNTNNINCFKGKIWGKRRPNNRFVLCLF